MMKIKLTMNKAMKFLVGILKPKTVFSLVLRCFILAVMPLLVCLVVALTSIHEYFEKESLLISKVVQSARLGSELDNGLIDLERTTRQYQLLKTQTLLTIYKKQNEYMIEKLDSLDEYSREKEKIREFQQILNQNKVLIKLELSEDVWLNVINNIDQMRSITNVLIEDNHQWRDAQILKLKDISQNIIKTFIIQGVLLISLTVFLILILLFKITKPIQQIDQAIHQLGDQKEIRDIHVSGPDDLQLLGQRLNWLRKRLNDLERQKMTFIRHMSHELKTPLANFKEGVELLFDEIPGPLNDSQKEVVEILNSNNYELQRRIENLLDLNQVLMKNQLNLELINVWEFMNERLSQFNLLAKTKNISFHIEGESLNIKADRVKFIAIMDNLISNAVHYSPLNSQVKIIWAIVEENFELSILDEGSGVPEEDQDKIFQPFYQGDSSLKDGPLKGSGIGLSVVKEFLNLHQGCIELKPTFKGACFNIKLPHGNMNEN